MAKRHKKNYAFTYAGRQAWEYAKKYSKRHFPHETKQYFSDVLDVIEALAANPHGYSYRDDLAAGTGLKIYGARKHYLIFSILLDDRIAIIAFEKKERDILGILSKRSEEIKRELSQLSST